MPNLPLLSYCSVCLLTFGLSAWAVFITYGRSSFSFVLLDSISLEARLEMLMEKLLLFSLGVSNTELEWSRLGWLLVFLIGEIIFSRLLSPLYGGLSFR